MEPLPTNAMCVPIAFPLSLLGKTEMRMAIPLAMMMADPTAESTLKKIRVHRFGAAPAAAEAKPKRMNPQI